MARYNVHYIDNHGAVIDLAGDHVDVDHLYVHADADINALASDIRIAYDLAPIAAYHIASRLRGHAPGTADASAQPAGDR